MSEWKLLPPVAANEAFEAIKDKLKADPSCCLEPDLSKLTMAEMDFRQMLMASAKEAMQRYPKELPGHWYLWGLHIGIDLVNFFESRAEPLLLWDAHDSQMWMQLSLNVVPDIIHMLSESRTPSAEVFYARPNRMLLRKVWWFVYLSMKTDGQGHLDSDATRARLEHLRDQDAKELLDRSSGGYHVEFTRDMMGRYSEYCTKNNVKGQEREEFFQALIREHHLRLQFTLPELEGYEAYFQAILSHAEQVINRWTTRRNERATRQTVKPTRPQSGKANQKKTIGDPVETKSSVPQSKSSKSSLEKNVAFDAKYFITHLKRSFRNHTEELVRQSHFARRAIEECKLAEETKDHTSAILAEFELRKSRQFIDDQLDKFLSFIGGGYELSKDDREAALMAFLSQDW